jgi:Fe-S cluster assembly protein SufD
VPMTQSVAASQSLAELHARIRATQPGHRHAWLAALRTQALETALRLGLPTQRLEEWKYTNPGLASRPDVSLLPRAATTDESATQNARIPGVEAIVTLIDGHVEKKLSRLTALPKGARVVDLATAFEQADPELKAALQRAPHSPQAALWHLNTAFAVDGVLVHIPKSVHVEQPIHIIHASTASGRSHPRLIIKLEEGAQAHVIVTWTGRAETEYHTNAVTQVILADGAVLDITRIGIDGTRGVHTGALDIDQGRASLVRDHAVNFGGAIVRHDLSQRFGDEAGECHLNGLYVAKGTQHIDNHTTIDHARPHCTSREFYKGVLDDKARGVFYGKVFVRKDAQKTDADQHNPNLLLSKGALVDSTPALEINADDVKCAHGSTIGQLDERHTFYLRSRGLDTATARSLLTHAFAKEVIDRVPLANVKTFLQAQLLSRLPGGQTVREALYDDAA